MEGAAFQTATCVFVFLVPQQLAALTPSFRSYLEANGGRRLMSQKFPVTGLPLQAQIEDCAVAAPDVDEVDHGRQDYFAGLGAAFLYRGKANVMD